MTVPACSASQPRRDWDRHRAQVRATNHARKVAETLLIIENPERFAQLYAEQGQLVDPVVYPTGPQQRTQDHAAFIEKQIARLQAHLDQLQAEVDEERGDGD
jgi:hypothetical protein